MYMILNKTVSFGTALVTTTTATVLQFPGLCPGLPGWTSTIFVRQSF